MPDRQTLIIATGNAHKVAEMRQALSAWFEVFGLPADYIAPAEDGASFAANARIKAEVAARRLGALCLADDSGLCVDALGGDPGIFSARFAGPDADDSTNNALLLERLREVPDGRRAAHFVCALSLADPSGEIGAFEGRFAGAIGHRPAGSNGFGYDPLFVLPDGRTSAELKPHDKRQRSHRGAALRALGAALEQGTLAL
jgi:XTP/dITP diphosphohydrolase